VTSNGKKFIPSFIKIPQLLDSYYAEETHRWSMAKFT